MESLDPSPGNDVRTNPAGAQADQAEDTVSEPNLRIVVPEKLHLHISLEGMPDSVSALFQKLAKPASESTLKIIFKDYLPALTPVATAVIAFLVAYYGGKFDDRLTRDTLDKITTEFMGKRSDPNIAAMKLSAYGDKAIPAVRMVLAAENDSLRKGGELIAQQMYLEGTVKHEKLLDEMMHDYDNPALQRGVLEWLDKMGLQLDEQDRERALNKLENLESGFGPNGQNCKNGEDDKIPFAAANLLLKWSSAPSKEFLGKSANLALGFAENCFDNEHSQKFDRVRTAAVNALTRMAKSLPANERKVIATRLGMLSPTASSGLGPVIDNAVTEINKTP